LGTTSKGSQYDLSHCEKSRGIKIKIEKNEEIMSENQENDPNKKSGFDKYNEKWRAFLERITKEGNVENVYNFAKTNTRDVIAYILLLTGLFLLFFNPSFGGTLIGVIFGLYFSQELYQSFKEYDHFIQLEGFVKSLVFGGLLLAFFISAPFIFIGAAVAVALRQLLVPFDK
jgi:hypothetical protein